MRLLIVEPRALFPTDSGARILSYNVYRHLSRRHELTIVFNHDFSRPEQLEQMKQVCSLPVPVPWKEPKKYTLGFYWELVKDVVAGELYTVKMYATPALKARAKEIASRTRYDAVITATLSASMPDVDFGQTPVIAFSHNVEYILRERQALRAGNTLVAAFLRNFARRTREFETRTYSRAEHVVTVSRVDAHHLRREMQIQNVSALPPGVDADYFAPMGEESTEPEIVFTGSMDWQANQDAVTFFVREVLPHIKREVPRVKFTIVGRRPPAQITALAAEDAEHVAVTGAVDDVRPYISRAQLAAVPVLFGSGIKIKVFEAMSMGKPVVVSTIGAEGLPLVDRENVLVADSAADMAERCIQLLCDAELRRRIGRNAREMITRGHDWSVVAAEFSRICSSVARRRAQR